MHCERCAGQMTYENFYGWESDAVWYYPGWRCIHCGEVVDPVIYLNRRLNNQHFFRNEEDRSEAPSLPFEVSVKEEGVGSGVYASVLDEADDDY